MFARPGIFRRDEPTLPRDAPAAPTGEDARPRRAAALVPSPGAGYRVVLLDYLAFLLDQEASYDQ